MRLTPAAISLSQPLLQPLLLLLFSFFQAERLEELQERLAVPYDGANPAHQEQLCELWALAFPGQPCEALKTPKWKDMGWQVGCEKAAERAIGPDFGMGWSVAGTFICTIKNTQQGTEIAGLMLAAMPGRRMCASQGRRLKWVVEAAAPKPAAIRHCLLVWQLSLLCMPGGSGASAS
jgi:hypothetical protein